MSRSPGAAPGEPSGACLIRHDPDGLSAVSDLYLSIYLLGARVSLSIYHPIYPSIYPSIFLSISKTTLERGQPIYLADN